MDVPEFNLEFNVARTRVRKAGGISAEEEQQRLRDLVPQLAEEERAWAIRMIERLPELAAPPAPPSPLMLRALEIQKAAFAKRGTRDEMITALAAARKEIWEIADSAPDENDGAQIGGLTRMLDHLEEGLNDPFWEVPEPPADRQD
jgi:hypothetical protein